MRHAYVYEQSMGPVRPEDNNSKSISMSQTHQLHSNTIQFDKCLEFLDKAGKEFFHPKFRIWEEDHYIIFKLLVYFYKDKVNAAKHDIDLNKGILLTGPVGCGKTSLMTILRFILAPKEQYIMKSTRDITLEFIQDGFPVIYKYSKSSFQQKSGELVPKTYCFDDLGVEVQYQILWERHQCHGRNPPEQVRHVH